MKYILRSLLFALMVFISQLSFAQKKFAHPERVRYDGSCMTIEGKDVFVYSAAFPLSGGIVERSFPPDQGGRI